VEPSAFPTPYGTVRKSPSDYWYFLPSLELPPDIYTPQLVKLLSEADRKLGELSGLGQLMPNPDLLVMPYVKREAVESSRIEGTQANLSDLFLGEVTDSPKDVRSDVFEVRNYVDAMEYGLGRLRALPLSTRLLCEMHEILMRGVRGDKATPGELRRSQNWIGAPGSTPANATYVPPPPGEMGELLSRWEKVLDAKDQLPPLLHIALLHWQFEAIHPFLDGNGRIGRLLITLYLCERNELSQPLLYLSEYFQAHRSEYLNHLLRVSQYGDWNTWFSFFLVAVRQQAEDAVETSKLIIQLQNKYRNRLHAAKVTPTTFHLLEQLFRNPYTTVASAAGRLAVSAPAARTAIERLEELKVLKEFTGKERNRLYCAEELLALLKAARA
jgi:Fic family protein